MKQCSWCGNVFSASVSYQIYCSLTCREEATKEKIAERHKAIRRQKKITKDRMCAAKCGTKLSVYNDDIFCSTCSVNPKEVNRKIREIRMFMHEYENNIKS